MSAAAAPTTEEGNRIEWFMASGTGTKRKSSSSASPTCVWMRRTRVDPASPSVLGLPHHLVSLKLVRLSRPQQTTTACAPLTTTVATASTPSRSASDLIIPVAVVAAAFRQWVRVFERTGVACSCGILPGRLLTAAFDVCLLGQIPLWGAAAKSMLRLWLDHDFVRDSMPPPEDTDDVLQGASVGGMPDGKVSFSGVRDRGHCCWFVAGAVVWLLFVFLDVGLVMVLVLALVVVHVIDLVRVLVIAMSYLCSFLLLQYVLFSYLATFQLVGPVVVHCCRRTGRWIGSTEIPCCGGWCTRPRAKGRPY
jgi:hypothetical protein